MKRSRRITLIDLLLLVVMMGVLVPWLLQTQEFQELGPVRFRVTERRRNGGLTLVADFSRVDETPAVASDIGMIVYDSAGNVLDSAFDLAPGSAKSMELIVSVPESTASYYIISLGERRTRIELTPKKP